MHAYEHAAGWVSHGTRMLDIMPRGNSLSCAFIMTQIFWNFKTELWVCAYSMVRQSAIADFSPCNASAPTWSYDQSVAQNWVPLDLADRV